MTDKFVKCKYFEIQRKYNRTSLLSIKYYSTRMPVNIGEKIDFTVSKSHIRDITE